MTASLMYVVCCVCGDVIESKPGPLDGISHGYCEGYCEGCYEEAIKDAARDKGNSAVASRSTTATVSMGGK